MVSLLLSKNTILKKNCKANFQEEVKKLALTVPIFVSHSEGKSYTIFVLQVDGNVEVLDRQLHPV